MNARTKSTQPKAFTICQASLREKRDIPSDQKEHLNLKTLETKDQSSNLDTSKEDPKAQLETKEQIEKIKNRINFIEGIKNKNKSKLETTAKKISTFMSIRTLTAEAIQKIEEKKIQDELQAKQLREKVSQIKTQTNKIIQEKKEQILKNKLTQCEKTKKEKLEMRQKLKRMQEEERNKKKLFVMKTQGSNSNISFCKVTSTPMNDVLYRKSDFIGMVTSTKGNNLLDRRASNLYESSIEQGHFSSNNLKFTLENLIKEEAKKIDELQTILTKQKEAENKFYEITKSKNNFK